MKIVHITYNTGGGAGRAVCRLHESMLGYGVDSHVVCVENRQRCAPATVIRPSKSIDDATEASVGDWAKLQEERINKKRSSLSNTAYHIGYPGYDLSVLPVVREADVIVLHWVPKILSIRTIERILQLGKPTYWVMHDYWALGAGAHFPAGLHNYQDEVFECPQLLGSDGLDALLREDRARAFDYENLTPVVLSRQMKERFDASPALAGRSAEVWYNGVETNVFKPLDPEQRQRLRRLSGIGDDEVVILNIAQNVRESRKGFAHLMRALSLLAEGAPASERLCTLMMIGAHRMPVPSENIRQINISPVNEDEQLVRLFAVCDLMVHPALEEGFSLVILEAMACGLPVMCFDNGGSRDLIKDGKNGYLIDELWDATALADRLAAVLADPSGLADLGNAARATIAGGYDIPHIGRKFLKMIGAKDLASGTYDPLDPDLYASALENSVELPLDPRLSRWLASQPLP